MTQQQIIEYTGEYGIEVEAFVPYVNHLFNSGKLKGKQILTYDGMQSYYHFLDPKLIKYKKQRRRWVPPSVRDWLPDHLKDEDMFFKNHDISKIGDIQSFQPPDYYTYYKQFKVESPKPLFIIQNKFNMEWGGPPINYIKLDTLRKTLPNICQNYKVIYIRSNNINLPGYSPDMNELYDFSMKEKEMLREEFPDVSLFEDMLGEYSFNELKGVLIAHAKHVLTVLGGAHSFAVYFPCNHIIHRCDRPVISDFPQEIFKDPYNLDPNVTTPDIFDRQWFQNTHDLLCRHPHGSLQLTRSHEELEAVLLDIK